MEEVVAEPFEPTRARVGLGALERDRHRAADPIHAWGWKGVPYVSYQYRVFWRFGPDILSWNLYEDGTKILYEIVRRFVVRFVVSGWVLALSVHTMARCRSATAVHNPAWEVVYVRW